MSQVRRKQNFLEKTKRFFEPVKYAQKYTYQQIFKWMLAWWLPFIHVIFFQKILSHIESGNQELFFSSLLSYFSIIILIEIVDLLSYNWWWFRLDPKIISVLTQKYTSRYMNLDNTTIETIWTGKSISIIDRWVTTWSRVLTLFFWNIGWITASFLITFFYIFSFSINIWILFFTIFSVLLLFSYFIDKKMRSIRFERIKIFHKYTRQLVKMIMMKNEIMFQKSVNQENKRIEEYMEKDVFYFNLRQAPYFHAIYKVPHFTITLLKFCVLYIYASLVLEWNISISVFVWLFWVFLLFEQSILLFVQFFKNFTKELAPIESLWDFFDTTPQIQGYEEWNIFEHKNGEIELRNISYGYTEDKKIFENFSLKIPGNKITALVWPSGWGKSTLVKLISGYIRADSGEIVIDNQKLSKTSLKSYYQDIWYLTQEPSVFDGTVRENLMYGVRENYGEQDFEEQFKNIITLANCEFIYDLPQWLDTEIGERWVKLSGWQKQRLAIAKIFLKDPKIIILDEPTSALDSLSEQKITAAMHNLFKGRTVIVIAHRLQTVKYANNILVIEDGKLKERGTHKSLIEKKGFYKQMLDLQSGF